MSLIKYTTKSVKRTYYLLTLLSTLAASLIWGINTLFLLDAGLSNTAAFTANAFFSLGMLLFEVPTGVAADIKGRRTSYALGSITLFLSTLVYFWLWQIEGPLWAWALTSVLLGLGFTFFSGATEAWLVDALDYTGFKGNLESVFARGQVVTGAAMLVGSVGGGYIAQATSLGVPYLIRAALLGATFLICLIMMRDLGFSPAKGKTFSKQVKGILSSAIEHGWRNDPVRYMVLSAPFAGIGIFVFYAMQPYLLELYGNEEAYGIAGLAAAIVAGAQIIGGFSIKYVRAIFRTRTGLLIAAEVIGVGVIALMALVPNFWVVVILLAVWGLLSALIMPVRQAYLNGLIESRHRATVLSFDALLDSGGGAATQPLLGRAADAQGYPTSFLMAAVIQAGALPFLIAARRKRAASDPIKR